jgi:uncharacterized membrane protein YbaN (DUF454 family)
MIKNMKRRFFFTLGTILIIIGTIGILVPVLPTTPLVLASFICFSRSSKRAEKWILKNRYFRSYIENYKANKGVPADVKIKSIIFLWITLIVSMVIFFNFYRVLLLAVVGVVVTTHIYLLKTKED